MVAQTGLVCCAWHHRHFPSEVPRGKVAVFRRRGLKMKQRVRFITLPARAVERVMSHGLCKRCQFEQYKETVAISAVVRESVHEMRRCIKRRR